MCALVLPHDRPWSGLNQPWNSIPPANRRTAAQQLNFLEIDFGETVLLGRCKTMPGDHYKWSRAVVWLACLNTLCFKAVWLVMRGIGLHDWVGTVPSYPARVLFSYTCFVRLSVGFIFNAILAYIQGLFPHHQFSPYIRSVNPTWKEPTARSVYVLIIWEMT